METDLYWAAKDSRDCVLACINKKVDYYNYCNQQGLMRLWHAVYIAYYASTEIGPYSQRAGERGNLVDVSINDFRNLIQHKVGLVINQNPVWEPMATSSDVKSLAQCKLARALLNYYQDVKRLRVKANNWVTNAAMFGEGFLLQTWDATVGERKFSLPNADGGVTHINEGDVDQRVFEPVDVIRDIQIQDSEQNHWYIVRQIRNKYDIAAKYPDLYNEITGLGFERDILEHYLSYINYSDSEDLVTMYTLIHKRTASVPKGRIINYINSSIILDDTELTHQNYPLHRIVDTEIKGKNFGYTDSFDMLQVQELTNGLWSTVVSNLNAFGIQNILLPQGSNISESQLSGGLNIIEYDAVSGGVPSALQLTQQPNGIWEALNGLGQKLETISGVNSTARGNPPAAVGSGVALSMLQSLNVQYNQGLQSNYISGMEAVGTALINLIKDYAAIPRVAAIVGEANASYLKEYQGKDVSEISRVVAKLGNPMANTAQGRYAIGEMLTAKGLIKDASQLLTVLETGNLDVLTEGRDMQLMYSKAIIDNLRQGKPVPAPIVTDDHLLHIRAIADLTADLSIRTDHIELLPAMMEQMMKHMQFLQNPNTSVLMVALQQQPLPQTPEPQGQPSPGTSSPNLSNTTNVSTTAGKMQNATISGGAGQSAPMPPMQPSPASSSTGQMPEINIQGE